MCLVVNLSRLASSRLWAAGTTRIASLFLLNTHSATERNGFRGPDYNDFDISVFKNFNFTESTYLQFRAESYNTFNRVNFSPPGGSATGSSAQIGGTVTTDVDSSDFMKILSAAPARQIQFALKFVF